ncbi:hypothetical protein NIES2111_16190 [Nostoc sp. NIES-2111]|nr:hypothetical protein NIES2111_16190 [Nostoc sp. NIES-2111]
MKTITHVVAVFLLTFSVVTRQKSTTATEEQQTNVDSSLSVPKTEIVPPATAPINTGAPIPSLLRDYRGIPNYKPYTPEVRLQQLPKVNVSHPDTDIIYNRVNQSLQQDIREHEEKQKKAEAEKLAAAERLIQELRRKQAEEEQMKIVFLVSCFLLASVLAVFFIVYRRKQPQ